MGKIVAFIKIYVLCSLLTSNGFEAAFHIIQLAMINVSCFAYKCII